MSLHVDIQSACTEPVPEEDDIRRWIRAAARDRAPENAEISVRLVGEAEMSSLNETYRGKTGVTNVLSFPSDLPEELELPLLGDIVICAPVVLAEAASQGKTPTAHWAHLTVHGTLHLLGYDHENDEEAAEMEALESRILNNLDFACPYEGESASEYTV